MRGNACGLFVFRGEGCGDFRCFTGFAESDGGAAESAAGHAGTDDTALPAYFAGDIDHDIEFLAGDIEVIAEGIMAGGHEWAEGFKIVSGESGGGGDGPGNFTYHVAGTAVDGIAEPVPIGLDIGGGDIAP